MFRLAGKFNLSHRISDIRQFIIAYPSLYIMSSGWLFLLNILLKCNSY